MQDRFLLCVYMYNLILLWMNRHLPVRLPSFYVVEIFQEFDAIWSVVDCQVNKSIICKESYGFIRDLF